MFTVDTIYRVQIDFGYRHDFDYESYYRSNQPTPVEKVINYAHKHNGNLHITSTGGGPCWGAYLIIEGENRTEVEAFARKVVAYIQRFKKALYIRE